jgi:ADP-ribose pyrophosphatase
VRIPVAEQRILARGRYLELVEERGWEYVRRTSATAVVVIVATTAERELVLVEQPRIPLHRRTIELPAGLVGDQPDTTDEPLEHAAVRELEEETGFLAARWMRMLDVPGNVGISAELVTFFRATELRRVGPGGGDHTEDITVHVVPLPDVADFLAAKQAAGALVDPKVLAGLYLLGQERRAGDSDRDRDRDRDEGGR